jgi:flagellar motor switch protein FliN/FliY
MNMTTDDVQRPDVRQFEAVPSPETSADGLSLAPVLDMQMTLSMEVGRVRIPIRQLVGLNVGSVVALGRAIDEAFAVFVNGRMIAQGDVVVVNERVGVRFTDVVTEAQRAKALE